MLPDVPAVAEALPGYEALVSYFFVAPAGVPSDIVAKLSAESMKALKQADTVERLARDGAVPVANTPEETAKVISSEIVRWGKAVNSSGAQEN